jgi:hypothetical protein
LGEIVKLRAEKTFDSRLLRNNSPRNRAGNYFSQHGIWAREQGIWPLPHPPKPDAPSQDRVFLAD